MPLTFDRAFTLCRNPISTVNVALLHEPIE
jgi:hypothetical protein